MMAAVNDIDIVREFLVESHENLDRLDQEFLALERNPADKETLASIFRTVHTLKGTSALLGFKRLEKLAHSGENLLSRLRSGQLRLQPEMASTLLTLVDVVRAMLASVESSGTEGNGDHSGLLASLDALAEGRPAPAPVPGAGSAAARGNAAERITGP